VACDPTFGPIYVPGTFDGLPTKPFWFPTFLVGALSVPTAAAKSMLAIFNGSTTHLLRVKEVQIQNVRTAAGTTERGVFEPRRFAGAAALTVGTVVTPESLDTSDVLPTGVIARHGGTVAGEVALFSYRAHLLTNPWGSGVMTTEAFQASQGDLFSPIRHGVSFDKPYTLRPNQGLSIKFTGALATGLFDLMMVVVTEALP
jgi:hypothetical protein